MAADRLTSAITAAKQAGAIVKQNFLKKQAITSKGSADIVTETDVAADQALRDIIQSSFPDDAFFSEESGLQEKQSDYLWIVDPLDGTTNFVHGISRFSVAIAALKHGAPYLGVVFNPISEELFSAELGKGAHRNGTAIAAKADAAALGRAVISMSRGSAAAEKKRHATLYAQMVDTVRSIRVLNSTALDATSVGAGYLNAHVNNGCKCYDYAAGAIIAMEAGATATTFTGDPLPFDITKQADVLIASPSLHSQFVEALERG